MYKHAHDMVYVLTFTKTFKCLCIWISDASSNITDTLATFCKIVLVFVCKYSDNVRPCRRMDVEEIARAEALSLFTQLSAAKYCRNIHATCVCYLFEIIFSKAKSAHITKSKVHTSYNLSPVVKASLCLYIQ